MVESLDSCLFDIDSKIGLDTPVEKQKKRRQKKKEEEELTAVSEEEEPKYEMTKENIQGRTHTSEGDEMAMPNKDEV